MKLSTKVRYGVRALVELASNYGRGPVLMKDISRNQRLSLKYLDHIFAQLKTAGLVKKLKAKRGGYLLARPPEEITLYEIIETLEGIEFVDCIEKELSCPLSPTCAARSIWKKLKERVRETMKDITLEDFVKEKVKLENKQCSSYTFYI